MCWQMAGLAGAAKGVSGRSRVAPCKATDTKASSEAKVRVRPPEEARRMGAHFCCPITKEPFIGTYTSPSLGVVYSERMSWVDLTLQRVGGSRGGVFETSQVSSLYEDYGWRDSFARAGFPGPDAELERALEYFGSAAQGTVVDISCATGLFTRRLANSGKFDTIVGLDISETMLAQCASRVEKRVATKIADRILLVRADVAQLPIETSSVDCVHAGAAIHCWPNAEIAVAEIARILKPGGIFCGTTFLDPVSGFVGQFVGDNTPVGPIVRRLRDARANAVNIGNDGVVRQWTEPELKATLENAGFVDFQRDRNWQYILYCGRRPSLDELPHVAP